MDIPLILTGKVGIKKVSSYKFLRAYIDEHLRFDAHIQFVVKKNSNYISVSFSFFIFIFFLVKPIVYQFGEFVEYSS